MKKILLSCLMLFMSIMSFSQNDILLVTDNNFDLADNTTMQNALLASTYTSVVVHNANTSGLPTIAMLNNYDLVIWFCGDDGLGLNFWSNGSAGIIDLKTYLDNGGKLWLIGSDILFEGYGSAPVNLAAGEFMYDYAWLNSYNMQTYADDGGLGVAQIDKNPLLTNIYPTPLNWIFSTIWYIDGVTPRANGLSIYELGPSTYPNAGETTMAFYENSTFSVMSSLFNATSLSTTASLNSFTQATLDHIFASSLSVSQNESNTVGIFPNPSNNYFTVSFKNNDLLNADFEIHSILGSVVLKGKLNENNTSIDITNLSKGTYFFKAGSITKKIIKY